MRQFARVALVQGRHYFRSGCVSDATQMGTAFHLTVRGRNDNYDVWIDFSEAGSKGILDTRCTCSFYAQGGLCKHLWASVIKLERSGLSGKVAGTGTLRLKHEAPNAPRVAESHRPAPLTLPQAVSSSGPTAWLERLDKIQGKGARGTAGFGNLVAAFVVNAAETISTGTLILDFWPRRRGPTGDTGPLRPTQLPKLDVQPFVESSDQELVALLLRTGSTKTVSLFGSPCTRFTVDPILETQVLTTLAEAGKVYLSRSPNGSPDNADRPLRMDRGKPWDVELRIVTAGSNYRIEGELKRDDDIKSLTEPTCVLTSGLLIMGERIGRLAEARHAAWLISLRSSELLVPQDQGDRLLTRILADSTAPHVTWPEGMGWKRLMIDPVAKGVFRPLGNDPSNGRMSMTLSFEYGLHDISLADQSDSIVDTENHQVYSRNRAFDG